MTEAGKGDKQPMSRSRSRGGFCSPICRILKKKKKKKLNSKLPGACEWGRGGDWLKGTNLEACD